MHRRMVVRWITHRLDAVAALEGAAVALVGRAASISAGNSSGSRKDGESKQGEGGTHVDEVEGELEGKLVERGLVRLKNQGKCESLL